MKKTKDFKEFIELVNSKNVPYLLIGLQAERKSY